MNTGGALREADALEHNVQHRLNNWIRIHLGSAPSARQIK